MAEAALPNHGFQWIGQTIASCDGCGRPAWEHEGIERYIFGKGDGPFSPVATKILPWTGNMLRRRQRWLAVALGVGDALDKLSEAALHAVRTEMEEEEYALRTMHALAGGLPEMTFGVIRDGQLAGYRISEGGNEA
jgi:hypothetical protein